MHLTRESEYALLGLRHLAAFPPGTLVSASDVARAGGLPTHFLSKIFQKLARSGVLTGGRGRGRGYALARHPSAVTVREILVAVEGSQSLEGCLFWQGFCGDANPCPLHHRMRDLHDRVRDALLEVTLADYLETANHRDVRS